MTCTSISTIRSFSRFLAVWRPNLGGCVIGAAAARGQEVSVGYDIRESKVTDLDVVVLVEKNIFRFEVAVHNLETMGIFDARYELLEEAAGLVFGHAAVGNDEVEEFARSVLKNKDNVGGSRDDLVTLIELIQRMDEGRSQLAA